MNKIVQDLDELLREADGVDKTISCLVCGIHPACEFSAQIGLGWNAKKDVWTIQAKNHQMKGWNHD